MKSYEWNVSDASFGEVDDPVYNENIGSHDEAIHQAGYIIQFSSEGERDHGASIMVYLTEDETKPRFYIDIMGQHHAIATLVARPLCQDSCRVI